MKLPYEDYIKSLPKKRVGAAAIFFDKDGKLLIVKPNYRDGWLVPGGIVEEFESPQNGCVREIKEEIGLDISNIKFLGVSHVGGVRKSGEKNDGVHFVFYGGVLNDDLISKIKIQEEELIEFRFEKSDIAFALLSEGLSKRIQEGIVALEKNSVFYIEQKIT